MYAEVLPFYGVRSAATSEVGSPDTEKGRGCRISLVQARHSKISLLSFYQVYPSRREPLDAKHILVIMKGYDERA
jgi:hypothetical protein